MAIVRNEYERLREDYNNPLGTNSLADKTISEVIGNAPEVREKVKHHSMILFGLACDITACIERCQDYEKKYIDLQERYKALTVRYSQLKVKYSRRCKRMS